MYTRRLTVVIALVLGANVAFAQAPNLGKPISPADIAGWDINVLPDGSGLTPGSGTPPRELASTRQNARVSRP